MSTPRCHYKEARERRHEARALLADGVDPSANRKAQKLATTDGAANRFEVIAREWWAKFSPAWAPAHSERIIRRLARDVFPWLGGRPVAAITVPELLAVTRRVEERGALETAHRALRNCGQVFRCAVSTGRAERAPSADLRGSRPPMPGEHFSSVTEPDKVGELLRARAGVT